MKLMIFWQLHADKRHDVFSGFADMDLADYQSMQGPNVNLIGRWHDVMNGTGVAIVETDDAEALSSWLMNWHAVADYDMVPVLDDEEAHALCTRMVEGGY